MSAKVMEAPKFGERIGNMLRLDFYRLFHTPALYIMMCVAAIIPAMLLTMTSENPDGTTTMEITNVWQVVESAGDKQASFSDFGTFANINMVYIFAGLLMSIFIAHDYSSGFVKNIFTVHAKKMDYVISKTLCGVVGGVGMLLAYVLGAVIAGAVVGVSFDVNIGGLILCMVSKAFLMFIFCSLFLGIAVFFKNRLWLTIIFTFLFGMMLYNAASIANLSAGILTVIISLLVGTVGAAGFGAVSSLFLKKRDLV